MSQKHVAVLMGGFSSERPVSLSSGKACADVLESEGYRVTRVDVDRDVAAVLADLYARDIRRVFVEGGPTVASAFIAAGLVDEYLIYLAPTLIGGPTLALGDIGVTTIAEQRRLAVTGVETLGDDILITARSI